MKKSKPPLIWIMVSLFLAGFAGPARGLGGQIEQNSGFQSHRFNRDFLSELTSDFAHVTTAPARWDKEDILTFSAILGGGLVLFSVEEDIRDWVRDRRTESRDDAARAVTALGDGAFILGLAATLYATGEVFQKDGLRRTALLSLESYLTSGAMVLAMKFLAGRSRPSTGRDHSDFQPFSTGSGYYSLPSGHSAAAFSAAAVLADGSESPVMDILAYGLATGVALSRIQLDKHWASDVWLGSILGYVVGKSIASLSRSRESGGLSFGFKIAPDSRGITLRFDF